MSNISKPCSALLHCKLKFFAVFYGLLNLPTLRKPEVWDILLFGNDSTKAVCREIDETHAHCQPLHVKPPAEYRHVSCSNDFK